MKCPSLSDAARGYLSLYIFCRKATLASVLRRSRIDGAKHAAAVIKLIVTRLRQAWPGVRLVVRGDSGFCRQRLIRWCERQCVGYVIGVARNARLHRWVEGWERLMEQSYADSGPSSGSSASSFTRPTVGTGHDA